MPRILLPLLVLLAANSTWAAPLTKDQTHLLHQASSQLEQALDRPALTASLFAQLRARVEITKADLDPEAIDTKVRHSLETQYLPPLLANYTLLYSKLKNAKADFGSLEAPRPFPFATGMAAALSADATGSTLKVHYSTQISGNDWRPQAVFSFTLHENRLVLTSIELRLAPTTQVHIDGL
jgi:hypothetical protein